jgi:hypothetical protein
MGAGSRSARGETEEEAAERPRQEAKKDEAHDLLKRELREVLQERDMEKEYLGSSLEEEWDFIKKYHEA